MARVVWAMAALLTLGLGCSEPSVVPVQSAMPSGGTSMGPPPTPAETIGDRMPLAVQLDCSKIGPGERPSTLYLAMTDANPSQGMVMTRVDGDVCASYGLNEDPAAPALALRCAFRGRGGYDGQPFDCSQDLAWISVCSPGFEELTLELRDDQECHDRARPSCDALARGEIGDYPYQPVLYEPVPKPDGDGHCRSFSQAPMNLLENDVSYPCPCATEP